MSASGSSRDRDRRRNGDRGGRSPGGSPRAAPRWPRRAPAGATRRRRRRDRRRRWPGARDPGRPRGSGRPGPDRGDRPRSLGPNRRRRQRRRGDQEPAPRRDAAGEVLDQHLAVNIRAPYLLVQAALPSLKASGSGAVVNISSSSASLAIPGQAVYGLTKAALEYLTRSWAAELAPWRIRVNCVAPGPDRHADPPDLGGRHGGRLRRAPRREPARDHRPAGRHRPLGLRRCATRTRRSRPARSSRSTAARPSTAGPRRSPTRPASAS